MKKLLLLAIAMVVVAPLCAAAQTPDLFVTGFDSSHNYAGYVDEYTQSGTFVRHFVPLGSGGLSQTYHLRFGPDGNLYVTSIQATPASSVSAIKKYDGSTGDYLGDVIQVVSDDLVFDNAGNMYVAAGYGVGTTVLKVNPYTGTVLRSYNLGFPGTASITFRPNGNLLVLGSADYHLDVFELDPNTGDKSLFATLNHEPRGITTGPDGRYYVTEPLGVDGGSGPDNTIEVIGPSGGPASPWSIGGYVGDYSVISNGKLYASGNGPVPYGVNVFDFATGQYVGSFAQGPYPIGIALGPTATITIHDVMRSEDPIYHSYPSVPPNVSVPVAVDFAETGNQVTFKVINGSADNGTAAVTSGPLTSSGTITVQGLTQTKSPSESSDGKSHAGQLVIIGQLADGTMVSRSRGFSVCAHPISAHCRFLGDLMGILGPKSQRFWGSAYQITVDSDSGNPNDLDQTNVAEFLQTVSASGPFADANPPPSPVFIPSTHPIEDDNAIGAATAADLINIMEMANNQGSSTTNQFLRFSCDRCGIQGDTQNGPVVPASGFLIKQSISKDATGTHFVHTQRTGNASNGVQAGTVDNSSDRLVPVFPMTVSGNITLQGSTNMAQSLTFAFRPTDGSPAFSQSLTPNSDGSFNITAPSGTYNLAIKGPKWLQKVVPVDTTHASLSGLTVTLLAGDINGDNQVSLADYILLRNAFGSTPSSSNWNPNADLNCDGQVTLADYVLLRNNFGKKGDP